MLKHKHRYPRLDEIRDEEIFSCFLCGMEFGSSWDLVEHSKKCTAPPALFEDDQDFDMSISDDDGDFFEQ